MLIGFDLLQSVDLTPKGYAIVRPCEVPFGISSLRGFNEVLTSKPNDETGVHFFLDDYQFERIWRSPDRYAHTLSEYPLVLSPDFSMYINYPTPLQQWNHYRNQLIGAWLQAIGIRIIATASWSDASSYAWCFDGLPEHSALAVSTVGCLKSPDSMQLFLAGLRELIRQKQPTQLLIYGKTTPTIERVLKSDGVGWQTFAHGIAVRLRSNN